MTCKSYWCTVEVTDDMYRLTRWSGNGFEPTIGNQYEYINMNSTVHDDCVRIMTVCQRSMLSDRESDNSLCTCMSAFKRNIIDIQCRSATQ